MNQLRSVLMFTFLVGWYHPQAQGVLEQYIEEGLANNQQLLQEAMAVQTSQLSYAESKGLFMPSVSFNADYTLAGGGRTIDFPVGDLLNPVYSSLNELTESNDFGQVENVNEMFLPNDFHETKIRIIQPLFNTDIYYSQRINQQLASVAEAKKAAYEKELIKEIQVAYYGYLQSEESIDIYDANEKALEELLRFNERRFQEHLITRDEVYRSEFQLEELRADRASALSQRETAVAYFNFLLNRPHDSEILKDESLELVFHEEVSIDRAIGHRSEISQLRYAQEAQLQSFKMASSNRFLPKINAVGDFGYQGFGYEFDSSQDFWLINVGLSWNLFSGFQNQHRAQKARIELDALESQERQLKSQIALEVVRAQTGLEAASSRLRSKRKALQAARRSFTITSSRYRENQALLVEYLDAQSSYVSAELDHSIAFYQQLTKQVELTRALAY